jgi:hypothetical protein
LPLERRVQRDVDLLVGGDLALGEGCRGDARQFLVSGTFS